MFCGAFDEGEHVTCCLAQVVVGGDFGKWHVVREPVDGESISSAKGTGYVALVTAVVLGGRADVPAIDAFGCHVGALIRCDVDNNTGSWWSKRGPVEIEGSVEAGVRMPIVGAVDARNEGDSV
jgi:hypothetical protein